MTIMALKPWRLLTCRPATCEITSPAATPAAAAGLPTATAEMGTPPGKGQGEGKVRVRLEVRVRVRVRVRC